MNARVSTIPHWGIGLSVIDSNGQFQAFLPLGATMHDVRVYDEDEEFGDDEEEEEEAEDEEEEYHDAEMEFEALVAERGHVTEEADEQNNESPETHATNQSSQSEGNNQSSASGSNEPVNGVVEEERQCRLRKLWDVITQKRAKTEAAFMKALYNEGSCCFKLIRNATVYESQLQPDQTSTIPVKASAARYNTLEERWSEKELVFALTPIFDGLHDVKDRLISFSVFNGQKNSKITPEKLAEAGFFSYGKLYIYNLRNIE